MLVLLSSSAPTAKRSVKLADEVLEARYPVTYSLFDNISAYYDFNLYLICRIIKEKAANGGIF